MGLFVDFSVKPFIKFGYLIIYLLLVFFQQQRRYSKAAKSNKCLHDVICSHKHQRDKPANDYYFRFHIILLFLACNYLIFYGMEYFSNKDHIEDQLVEELKNALDQRRNAIYKLNSSLLIASATVFSIVISITLALSDSNHIHGMAVRCLLVAGILLNGIYILTASYLLHSEIVYHNLYLGKVVEQQQLLHNNEYRNATTYGSKRLDGVSLPPRYIKIQRASYILFCLMVVCYSTYAIMKVF